MANHWSSNTQQESQRVVWSDPLPAAYVLWLCSHNTTNEYTLALQKAMKAQGIRLELVDIFEVTSMQVAEADLILLDAFERLDGTIETVLTGIRMEHRVPLVMLTNGYSTEQLVTALTAGADAVWAVTIPIEVLLARCKAILRRSSLLIS